MRYPNLTSNRFAPPFVFLLPEDFDIDEAEWLQAAAANPAFDFLKDPEEDSYTLSEGDRFMNRSTRSQQTHIR